MRIAGRGIEFIQQPAAEFLIEVMLDPVCWHVEVIRGELEVLLQIGFPEAMSLHNLGCSLPAGRRRSDTLLRIATA